MCAPDDQCADRCDGVALHGFVIGVVCRQVVEQCVSGYLDRQISRNQAQAMDQAQKEEERGHNCLTPKEVNNAQTRDKAGDGRGVRKKTRAKVEKALSERDEGRIRGGNTT